MSSYVWQSGLSYPQYLQAQTFVADVTSAQDRSTMAVKRAADAVVCQMSRNTADLIASQEQLAERGHEILSQGMDEISLSMGRVADAVDQACQELNATFQWGFSSVLTRLGGMSDSLAELVEGDKTPAQRSAYEQFHIAREACRKGLYPGALEALQRAIQGDQRSPGYKLDWRFHQLAGVIRLGFVGVDPALIDLQAAESSFALAGRYAEFDHKLDAARAYLSAGWAAYCQGKFMEALSHTIKAIETDEQISEAYFQAAKICAADGEMPDSFVFLQTAIARDKEYALKAAADGDFARHGAALDGFLRTLAAGFRESAEDRVARLVGALDAANTWGRRSNDACFPEKSLEEAQRHIASGTLYGYMCAAELASGAQARADACVASAEKELRNYLRVLRIGNRDRLKSQVNQGSASLPEVRMALDKAKALMEAAAAGVAADSPEGIRTSIEVQEEVKKALVYAKEVAKVAIVRSDSEHLGTDRTDDMRDGRQRQGLCIECGGTRGFLLQAFGVTRCWVCIRKSWS